MDTGMPRAVTPPPPPPGTGQGGPRRSAPRARPATATGKRQIRDGLLTWFNVGEMMLAGTGDIISAEVWHHGAPMCADAWADLAAQNEAVNRALSKLVEGGAWGAAIGTSVAMLAPIVANNVPMNPMAQMMLHGLASRLIDEERTTERFKNYMARRNAAQAQQQAAQNGTGRVQN